MAVKRKEVNCMLEWIPLIKTAWDTITGIASQAQPIANLAMAQRSYDTQMALNTMERERQDNAIQRRKADIIAAGYNPNLVNPQAAVTSGQHVGSTPVMESPLGPQLQQLQLQKITNDVALSNIQKQTALIEQAVKMYEMKTKEHDFNILDKLPIRSTDNLFTGPISMGIGGIVPLMNKGIDLIAELTKILPGIEKNPVSMFYLNKALEYGGAR